MTDLILRPEVLRFAQVMEARLRDNDHKGGWENESDSYLLRRLDEETTELQRAVFGMTDEYIIMEAADVANFAMMIADNHREEPHD
jgi:hypothetical protein